MNTNLYELLKPVKVNNLVRIGSQYDGGYWLPSCLLNKSKVLIGLGIFINWSFEEEFIQQADNTIQTFLADASVNELFFKNYIYKGGAKFVYFTIKQPLSITFFYKKHIANSIGLSNKWSNFIANNSIIFNPKFLTATEGINQISPSQLLQQVLEKAKPLENEILVKMDIEGSEYDVLNLLEPYFKYINCFLIEFHHLKNKKDFFEKSVLLLTKYYQIVFVHNNNYTAMIDENFTDAIEITFVKRELVDESYISTNYNFSEHDLAISPCNPTKPDFQPGY